MFENRIWNWLVVSSADPNQVSLTVKGILLGVIPYLTTLLPLIGVHPAFDLNSIADGIYTIVLSFFTALSALFTLFGVVRKLINTFKTTSA